MSAPPFKILPTVATQTVPAATVRNGLPGRMPEPFGQAGHARLWHSVFWPDPMLAIEDDAHRAMREALEQMTDSEDAQAVPPETVEISEEVIDLLAGYVREIPDISANSRGEIEFSWNVSGRMLLLGVCPGGIIAFAAVHGESRVRGREPWRGDLPAVVPCLLKSLVA